MNLDQNRVVQILVSFSVVIMNKLKILNGFQGSGEKLQILGFFKKNKMNHFKYRMLDINQCRYGKQESERNMLAKLRNVKTRKKRKYCPFVPGKIE